MVSESTLSQLSGRPPFSREQAAEVVRTHWGIDGHLEPLHSERDQNWRVIRNRQPSVVAKFANSADDVGIIDLQRRMMSTLSAAGIPCPAPIPTSGGQLSITVDGHPVWLIDFLPGTVMADLPRSVGLCTNLGEIVGGSAAALLHFDHPAAHRDIQWDMSHADKVFTAYAQHIADPTRREIVEGIHRRFVTWTLPVLTGLPQGIIHNDVNDHNVLVTDDRVAALLDFGDAVYSAVVNDLAVACAYAMLDNPDPIAIRDALVAGYQRHRRLLPDERALLPDLIRTRLAVSVTISAYQRMREPHNSYLTVSETSAWHLLTRLEELETS